MAAENGSIGFGCFDCLERIAQKIENPDCFAVAGDFTARAEQADLAMACLGESGHGENGRTAAFEFQGDDLMVHHIVVAGIDATPIRSGAKGFAEGGFGGFRSDDVDGPAGMAACQSAEVNFKGGIGAMRLDGAIEAAVGGTVGSVFGAEVEEGTERGDLPARDAEDMAEPVEIMARFGEQHGGGLEGVSPSASDEGVGLMPITHWFQQLNADKVADGSRIEYFAEPAGKGGITHDVADGKEDAGAQDGLRDAAAIGWIGGHRLFQEDGVPLLGEGDCGFRMHRVLGADQDGVCETGFFGRFLPVRKDVGAGDVMLTGEAFAVEGAGFGDADDSSTIGVSFGECGVTRSTAAGADDEQRDRAVHELYPFSMRWETSLKPIST